MTWQHSFVDQIYYPINQQKQRFGATERTDSSAIHMVNGYRLWSWFCADRPQTYPFGAGLSPIYSTFAPLNHCNLKATFGKVQRTCYESIGC
ncbi:MAG: hypothetical protein ACI81Q_001992 [Paracoccaceae bacterium]|jgi:hypothetical protein